MRFYSEIRMEPQKHLDEICKNPYLTFSNDFIYYITGLHGVNWHPTTLKPVVYQPHPFSPCTENVKNAIEEVLVKSKLNYDWIYDQLVPADADNKLELFSKRMQSVFDKLDDHPLDAFFALLHVGRWTVAFYKRGITESPHLASHLMADALRKVVENTVIRMWFHQFDITTKDIAGLLKGGFIERYAEEYDCYYEDLEELDEYDESSLCVCGRCEDLFESSEEYDDEEDEYDESSLCSCGHCKDLFEGSEEYDEEIGVHDDLDSDDYDNCVYNDSE